MLKHFAKAALLLSLTAFAPLLPAHAGAGVAAAHQSFAQAHLPRSHIQVGRRLCLRCYNSWTRSYYQYCDGWTCPMT